MFVIVWAIYLGTHGRYYLVIAENGKYEILWINIRKISE